MNQDLRKSFRFSRDLWESIVNAAREDGMPIGVWIRHTLTQAVKRRK